MGRLQTIAFGLFCGALGVLAAIAWLPSPPGTAPCSTHDVKDMLAPHTDDAGAGRAFVSVMWDRCDVGVVATKAMLQLYGSTERYVVFVRNVSRVCKEALRVVNISVKPLPDLGNDERLRKDLGKAREYLLKFALFALDGLTEAGTRLVALDTDAIPAQRIDEMFDFPTPEVPLLAASDTAPTFQMNTGVLAYRMYPGMLEEVLATIRKVGDSLGDGDQDILSYHFQVVKGLHSFLPGRYNSPIMNLLFGKRKRNNIINHPSLGPDGFVKVVHYTKGGFAQRCHWLTWQEWPMNRTDPKGRKHVSAMLVVARQCCAAQRLLEAAGKGFAVLGLRRIDALRCADVQKLIDRAGLGHPRA